MYQALYRKYRPKNFDEVVGQDFVTKTLKNSIINNKINHAYMFFGPRGIGKTTIAKILSRSINCTNSTDGNPCEKCDNCLKSSTSVDIIEIDAASNNGVDEIREIKSKVNIVPSELKYKVYIIDEVHMLTTGAFNALLKTLEEPPKHVIFILATTDPEKVSETIISRCQCYSFKRISVENIVKKLKEVCDKEQIEISESVLEMIAETSEGGLRDSLGLLDKLSSYKREKITEEDFYEINDMINLNELNEFKNSILNYDYQNVIEMLKKYNNDGKNLIEIIKQLLNLLRDELVDLYTSNSSLNNEELVELLNLLNEKMINIKKSSNPKIYIEILLLKFINDNKTNIQYDNKEKNPKEEQKEESKSNQTVEKQQENEDNSLKEIPIKTKKEIVDQQKKSNIDEIINIRINNIFANATKKEKNDDLKKIEALNEFVFNQDYGHIVSEILNAELQVSSDYGIILSYEYDSVVKQNIERLEQITEIYNKLTNSNKKIAIITTDEWKKLKKKYVENLKSGKKYDIIEEPELVVEELDEGKSENTLDLFKDIVEIN